MGYVRPKRAKRPANRPKWPSHSFRRRVWATRFFEIHDPGAFDEHFFNGLVEVVAEADIHRLRVAPGSVFTHPGFEVFAPQRGSHRDRQNHLATSPQYRLASKGQDSSQYPGIHRGKMAKTCELPVGGKLDIQPIQATEECKCLDSVRRGRLVQC